jgi:hypothetical protein
LHKEVSRWRRRGRVTRKRFVERRYGWPINRAEQRRRLRRNWESTRARSTTGARSSTSKKSDGVLRESRQVKYDLIAGCRSEFPVVLMCRMLSVSRSGFYSWLKREPSAQAQRRMLPAVCHRLPYRLCPAAAELLVPELRLPAESSAIFDRNGGSAVVERSQKAVASSFRAASASTREIHSVGTAK